MSKRMKRTFVVFCVLVMVFSITTIAFATDDPLQVVNNLSEFIFGLIRAIGMILLVFGIVQVGLSLKSHDPSQRANGFLTLAGGIIITFAKEILSLITGWWRRGMNPITEQMHIHSLNGALAEATIVEKVGDNKYIAEYNGVRCTAIYNPFVNRYYVDDKYGVVKERTPHKDDPCR